MSAAPGPPTGIRRGSAGFTLVELMVVVTVIGLLAGIAVPNYKKATERARRSSCLMNQHHMAIAGMLYLSDTGLQNGLVNSSTLHDLGYATDEMCDCPASEVADHSDYDLTVVDGYVQQIECLVRGAEHAP